MSSSTANQENRAKEEILKRLRNNTRIHKACSPHGAHMADGLYEMPDLSLLHATTFDNPVEEFKKKTTTTAGARLIEVNAGSKEIGCMVNEAVRKAFPRAGIFASNLEGIEAQLNPDTVERAQELMKVDVAIVEGRIGVAENACIWVPQTMKEKAVCFACEQLVIVLHASDIVSNMHEAYARIESSGEYFRQYKFGTFISGPSKTADIESALVYGAQAARGVTVVLIG